MLIKLVPAPQHPTILFNVDFSNLPPALPTPTYWAIQLNALTSDDLEVPRSFHSLDKAAGIPSLLQEVAFDLPSLTVSCFYIDGSVEEWPLMESSCVAALERVIDDVNESGIETAREIQWEKDLEREKERLNGASSSAHPVAPTKTIRHKKQRSLLMTLVASLVPLSVISPPQSPPRPPPKDIAPPPPPPSTPPKYVAPRISPRDQRKRARATLVDTFRQYILPELVRRAPPGGYYIWIIQSTLRRVDNHIADIVHEAGGRVPEQYQLCGSWVNSEGYYCSEIDDPLSSSPSSQFFAEEEDGSTDTDGSSLHTPTSSTFAPSPQEPPPSYDQLDAQRSSANASHNLSPEALAAYTELSAFSMRLRQLRMLTAARHAHYEGELKHRDAMLEIRGRRKAWLNKTLVGGSRGGSRDVGLATPFTRSRLGACVISAEDLERMDYAEWTSDADTLCESSPTRLNSMKFRDVRLFPVSEEEENYEEDDDAFLVARELEHGFELDLEDGLAWAHDCEVEEEEEGRLAVEYERPQIMPRVRTTSMRPQHRLDLDLEFRAMTRPTLSNDSLPLLCQPLALRDEKPEFDTEGYEGCGGVGVGGGFLEEEFTLAMDLPFSMHMQDRDGRQLQKRGGGLGYGVDQEHTRAWLASGMTNAVDCR